MKLKDLPLGELVDQLGQIKAQIVAASSRAASPHAAISRIGRDQLHTLYMVEGAIHDEIHDRINPPEPEPEPEDSPILKAMGGAADSALYHTMHEVLVEYIELWKTKHHDYGPENHGIWRDKGVVVRLTDKVLRLKRHYFGGYAMKNERVEDTWLDIIGYGLIGLVLYRREWPWFSLEAILDDMEMQVDNELAACQRERHTQEC